MRHIIAVGFLFALCGCSGLSDMLSFNHDAADDETPVATQAAAAPTPVAAPADSFCQNVAVNDATAQGYDPETQKKVAVQSYTQCHAIFNR